MEIKPSDIKYAIQPTYKPNIRELSTENILGEQIIVEKSIKRPPLFTERINKGKIQLRFSYEKSRYKPLKKVTKGISNKINKAMFLSFTKSRVGTVSLVNLQQKIGKPIEIYTQEPIIKSQGKTKVRLPLSREDILRITKGKQSPMIFPFTKQKKETRILPTAYKKIISKTMGKELIKVRQPVTTIFKETLKPRDKIINKIRNEIRIKTPTKSINREKSISKTVQKSIQKTLQRQRVMQRVLQKGGRSTTKTIFTPTPTPSTIIPPIILFSKIPTRKKRRRKQGFGYFYREFRLTDLFEKPKKKKKRKK